MSDLRMTLDVSAVPERPAGAGRYVLELARELATVDDVDLNLVSRRNDTWRWTEMPRTPRVLPLAPAGRLPRHAWEQVRLPGILTAEGVSLHHGPHYTLPERAKTALVSTIHDMTFFDHPEWHEKAKVFVFRRAIENAVRRADALIAVSNDTATRLQARFGTLPVTVIPHGVDHARFHDRPMERERELLDGLGVPPEYVAFVGTIEPRKDVPSLLAAFDRLASSRPSLRLVLTGRDGWGMGDVQRALGAMRHADRVVRTGFLPDDAVPALLRQAKAVAYPSLTEGFGLPALEALACGAALVTTRGSAMEEVVDDSAVLIEPGDVEALTHGLEALLGDEGLVARLRADGPKTAAKYTWSTCAAAHVEVYRSVAASRAR